jgi:hypothetical protein
VRDVLYGYGIEIERSGQDFYAHKTGFTEKSLSAILKKCGFPYQFIGSSNLAIHALALKKQPTDFATKLFGLPTSIP